jgi:hypothetical protein
MCHIMCAIHIPLGENLCTLLAFHQDSMSLACLAHRYAVISDYQAILNDIDICQLAVNMDLYRMDIHQPLAIASSNMPCTPGKDTWRCSKLHGAPQVHSSCDLVDLHLHRCPKKTLVRYPSLNAHQLWTESAIGSAVLSDCYLECIECIATCVVVKGNKIRVPSVFLAADT